MRSFIARKVHPSGTNDGDAANVTDNKQRPVLYHKSSTSNA